MEDDGLDGGGREWREEIGIWANRLLIHMYGVSKFD